MNRFLLALPALCLVGCTFDLGVPPIAGSGKITKEVREVGDFSQILFEGGGDIEYVAGDTPICEIEVDDNLQEKIVTKVEEGRLTISVEGSIAPSTRMLVKLSSSNVDAITASGSCNMTAKGIQAQQLELSISGSGKATLNGVTEQFNISIAGAGNVDSLGLAATDVSVSISGSGSVQVKAEKTLDVSVSGSGKVEYAGNATVTQSISGSGSIKQIAPE